MCALLAGHAAAEAAKTTAEETAEEARGRLLFWGGGDLRATLAHGAPLPPALAACVRCHRPSGHGASETEARTASIAAPVLFAPLAPRRDILLRDLYQERYGPLAKAAARTPRSRAAYAGAQDVARALREGLDPDGAPLSPAMPRYAVSDAAAAALTAYLRTLGATRDPGHDAQSWTFATVVTPDAPQKRRSPPRLR